MSGHLSEALAKQEMSRSPWQGAREEGRLCEPPSCWLGAGPHSLLGVSSPAHPPPVRTADESGCGRAKRWEGRGGVLQGGIPMAPPSGELERLS